MSAGMTDPVTGRLWRALIGEHLRIGLPLGWALRYALAGVPADWLLAAVLNGGFELRPRVSTSWATDPVVLLARLSEHFHDHPDSVPGRLIPPGTPPDLSFVKPDRKPGTSNWSSAQPDPDLLLFRDKYQKHVSRLVDGPRWLLDLYGAPDTPVPAAITDTTSLAAEALSARTGERADELTLLCFALHVHIPTDRLKMRQLYQQVAGRDIGVRPYQGGHPHDDSTYDRMIACRFDPTLWPLLAKRYAPREPKYSQDWEWLARFSHETWLNWLAALHATGQNPDLASAAIRAGVDATVLAGWKAAGVPLDRAILLCAAGYTPDEADAVLDLTDDDLHALASLRTAV